MGSNRAIAGLIAEISSDWYGVVSPSVYETARLVTLAPWLDGHPQRLRFLLDEQHRNGTWGGPGGYGLVPTLSATEALLSSLRRWHGENGPTGGPAIGYGDLACAADRGLRALFGWLGTASRIVVPDTIAVEILIPALVEQVNTHLDRLAGEPVTGLDIWSGSGRLALPRGLDSGLLMRLRHAVRHGHGLPTRMLHSLEALGPGVRGFPFVRPVQGAVGCSPAATAAWLDDRPRYAAVNYLKTVQSRGGGPVPGVTPITVFERVWVLAALTAAGIRVTLPPGLAGSLHAAIGKFGAAAGPGLPPDSDDTAGVLCVLARLGHPRSAQCLWAYRVNGHFSCFPGERTSSTSTNAHILQAFDMCLRHDPSQRFHYQTAMDGLAGWLRNRQETDGSWWDKWHSSPYYATACCAMALHQYSHAESAAAVFKTIEWLLDSQREDGSWGRWSGTHEETAYAVQTLLQTGASRTDHTIEQAAARGCAFLQKSTAGRKHSPLWHDKDLYTPDRVVRAERLAALHLAYTNPRVAEKIGRGATEDPTQEMAG